MNQNNPMWKLILLANLIVFILELFFFKGSDIRFFCIDINNFHIHQFITYQFFHMNYSHIFSNMLGLVLFGPPIENFLGRNKFLFSYLFCGVIGALFQIYGLNTILLGASGAVFGLLGLYLLFINSIVKTKLHIFLTFLSIFKISEEILNIFLGTKDNIGHWTHIGGVVGSIIVFLIYRHGKRNRMEI
jgi:membrane associated rhomboid family serine protease